MTQSNFIRLLKISRHISFKTIKKADFENATDNQGGGPIGYYRLDINKNPSDLQSILNITSFQKRQLLNQ